MRERLLLKCAAILLFASFAAFGQEFKPEALYKKAVPSVMTLKAEKKDGSVVLGSAFLLTNSGIAATAWHVVNGVTHVSARFSDGEDFEVSGLVDKDEKRDLALIRVKVFGRPELTLVGDDPQVGSRAYVIGAPLGLEFSITEGLLSQIQRINNVKQYQFSSPASPGNSGGPLLDADGQVLGVVSWQVKDGQNLNFAVPSSYLQGLDKTLPTMPWDAVRPSTATPATRPSSSSQPVGRMDRAVDRTLQEGLHATLPPKLSTLLGISAGTERPVMQSLLRSEKVVRGFDVLVANRNDVVIFIVNETANNQILYLTSRDGALQKMVSVKRGIGAVLQISSEDREAFEAEKQFWLDRLVPR